MRKIEYFNIIVIIIMNFPIILQNYDYNYTYYSKYDLLNCLTCVIIKDLSHIICDYAYDIFYKVIEYIDDRKIVTDIFYPKSDFTLHFPYLLIKKTGSRNKIFDCPDNRYQKCHTTLKNQIVYILTKNKKYYLIEFDITTNKIKTHILNFMNNINFYEICKIEIYNHLYILVRKNKDYGTIYEINLNMDNFSRKLNIINKKSSIAYSWFIWENELHYYEDCYNIHYFRTFDLNDKLFRCTEKKIEIGINEIIFVNNCVNIKTKLPIPIKDNFFSVYSNDLIYICGESNNDKIIYEYCIESQNVIQYYFDDNIECVNYDDLLIINKYDNGKCIFFNQHLSGMFIVSKCLR
jgi:hypothetical protein